MLKKLLLLVTVIVMVQPAVSKNKKSAVKKPFGEMYYAKCIKESILQLDLATKVCRCRTSGMLEHLKSPKELLPLITAQPKLSLEELANRDDPNLDTLDDLDYQVGASCENKLLPKKK